MEDPYSYMYVCNILAVTRKTKLKKRGLSRIYAHKTATTCAVLYQLSYQANEEIQVAPAVGLMARQGKKMMTALANYKRKSKSPQIPSLVRFSLFTNSYIIKQLTIQKEKYFNRLKLFIK